jgi:hydrogenase maturation protease
MPAESATAIAEPDVMEEWCLVRELDPCLVRAPDPWLVREPDPWLVREPDPYLVREAVGEPDPPRVVVLGMGNVLVGDDAFGPFVARKLDARYLMAPGVEVHDIGTPGLDLVPHIAGIDMVIVIDTVTTKAEPGSIFRYHSAELKARGPSARSNPHQPTLADTLFLLEVQDLAPRELLLVGVVPARYDTGAPLSAPVRAAVPEVMSMIVSELERLGCPPTPRERPLAADIWWEQLPRSATYAAADGSGMREV